MLRTLAFRELALRFLDSYNPQPDKAIAVANAIVEFDCRILVADSRQLRYSAHDFVRMAVGYIEFCVDPGDSAMAEWIKDFWKH